MSSSPSRDIPARLKETTLEWSHVNAIASAYRFPRSWEYRKPTEDERTSTLSGGWIAIHLDSLQHGLRLPFNLFVLDFLRDEMMVPAQLHPHGWAILAGFFVLCHRHGVEPSCDLFRVFYRVRQSPNETEFFSFQSTRTEKLFSDPLSKVDSFEYRWLAVRPPLSTKMRRS